MTSEDVGEHEWDLGARPKTRTSGRSFEAFSPLAGDSLRLDLPTPGPIKPTRPSDSSKLKSQPQAPALEAYTMMDEESSSEYQDLRMALLLKFDISPETYRQRFWAVATPPGETPTET
ncbi:hypothetical protein SKAU_G00413170 [Synaphobranchus kaupii]|uniref:Uncharacterized protein n=1 Tax=Synaphobranchus kaupii TaxID=118154 RepID=A0A9Q1E846_SYNKA|nr:hypothetical protein SKAU_G00413170 [Synaphobranchus kaupii]